MLATLAANDREVCVCDFTDALPLNQPTVSHHLRILRESGLVTCERRGSWVYYQLDPDARQRLDVALSTVFRRRLTPWSNMREIVFGWLAPVHNANADRVSFRTEPIARELLASLRHDQMKRNVLFVCVHNSARSQMAEAFVNEMCSNDFIAQSAGLEPGNVSPLAVAVMREVGIDIAACETAQRLHWSFVDPASLRGTWGRAKLSAHATSEMRSAQRSLHRAKRLAPVPAEASRHRIAYKKTPA